MDKNLVRAVALATQTIFQDMIDWEMRVDGITTNKGPQNGAAELNAIITFNGTLSGAFILHCPEALSATIASEMLGTTCEVGSADTQDAIGELLNMIVGGVKNHYQNQADPFRISVPTIVAGTDFSVHVKVKSEDEVISFGFQHVGGDEHVGLRLMLVSE
ncbi:MAG: chemotaxis protein CheX [Spirochaetales bacterium]|nr:chemotaxis protein CheX [Spirochaetales bacterium]